MTYSSAVFKVTIKTTPSFFTSLTLLMILTSTFCLQSDDEDLRAAQMRKISLLIDKVRKEHVLALEQELLCSVITIERDIFRRE